MSEAATIRAKCNECGREMVEGGGCRVRASFLFVPRVPFKLGDQGGEPADRPCHDCGVAIGQFHHPGCDRVSAWIALAGAAPLNEQR